MHTTMLKQRICHDEGIRGHRIRSRRVTKESLHDVMRVIRIPRTALRPGAVLFARIGFAEGGDYKIRPVVVISSAGDILTVRPGTSSAKAALRPGTYRLADLDHAGLTKPTALLPAREICLDDVVAVGGHLSPRDMAFALDHPSTSHNTTTTMQRKYA
jgi:hypothetical protein